MNIVFHKESLKLAGLYLAIVMSISLFFSGIVYQLSAQEFKRGLLRPVQGYELQLNDGIIGNWREQLMAERQVQYDAATHRIIQRLLILNLLIFIGGGLLCYYLAERTLRPIEEAQETLERFTADASHELRTPLTVMKSENEVTLMDPKLTIGKAKEQIKSNIEELEKLSALSEGLLKIARSGSDNLDIKAVDPAQVMAMAQDRVLPLAEQKKVLIKTSVTGSPMIAGDEASLIEALVILLDNAIKYSPPSSEITVSALRRSKEVVVRVSDAGIGIQAEDLPHIFDRFYRADAARSKQDAGGYGLGLAIAKMIVEKHHGSITVVSKPGKGAVFSITLPGINQK
ncbi:MAG: HAMP domain-containing histidine kinase [Candidatus Saccharibacteria bacterium]|nr:HAMP domain-containing histidine kinase [Candidatus Saccharibacteria bacterium]